LQYPSSKPQNSLHPNTTSDNIIDRHCVTPERPAILYDWPSSSLSLSPVSAEFAQPAGKKIVPFHRYTQNADNEYIISEEPLETRRKTHYYFRFSSPRFDGKIPSAATTSLKIKTFHNSTSTTCDTYLYDRQRLRLERPRATSISPRCMLSRLLNGNGVRGKKDCDINIDHTCNLFSRI